MASPTSTNSKINQIYNRIAQYIGLNLVFLICCIPIVTIGAAETGLMNASRLLQNPYNDESCFKAFFRGMKSGFAKITLIWCLVVLLLAINAFNLVYLNKLFDGATTGISSLVITLLLLYQPMTVAFHSRFDTTVWQIFRNSWFLVFMHPIRAVELALFMWLPFIVAVMQFEMFLRLIPIWVLLYFGAIYSICVQVVSKPLQEIEELAITEESGREAANEVGTD